MFRLVQRHNKQNGGKVSRKLIIAMETDSFDSPPCLIVESSQTGDVEYPPATHLNLLTKLAISKSPLERAKVVKCLPLGGQQQGNPQPQGGNGSGHDGNPGHSSGGAFGGAGGRFGGEGSGVDGDGDGDGGGGDGEVAEGVSDADEDTTSHESGQPSSSSDSIPQLVPAGSLGARDSLGARESRFSASELVGARSLSDSSSISQSPGGARPGVSPSYSQASTDVPAGGGVANISDVQSASEHSCPSEASSTAQVQSNSTTPVQSNSTTSTVSRSGSSSGSSGYPADLSSNMNTSSSSAAEIPHCSANPPHRTQSTSDASSGSAGSKQSRSHSRTQGYAMLKCGDEKRNQGSSNQHDDTDTCSSQDDSHQREGPGHVHTLSSQEVSKLHTPQHMSTPMYGSQQVPGPSQSLYKQALVRHSSSTPLEDGQTHIVPTPSSEAFSCLQFSGTVKDTSSSSDAQISPSPDRFIIIPSTPTEEKEKSPLSESLADDEVVIPAWQQRARHLQEMTPETTSEQNEKLQSSAGMNSTSGSSADVSDSHPWQSALSEEGSTHYDDRPQDAGAFLEESEVCVLPAVTLKPVQQPSLSPSSMVLEPYQQAEDSHKAQGPSQLELSQDLFQPCISPPEEAVQSVHATEELEISGNLPPAEEFQSSFALHFTPSQSQESLQVPSQGMDVTESPDTEPTAESPVEIHKHVKPNVYGRGQGIRASSTEKQTGGLRKQNSSESQSILAVLVTDGLAGKTDGKRKSETNRSEAAVVLVHQDAAQAKGHSGERRGTESFHPPSRGVADKDSVSVAEGPGHEKTATNEYDPPALSSETSSESASGVAFHFSLPRSGEPLRPSLCNTPPSVKQAPDANARETGTENAPVTSVVPLVPETPGMSAEDQATQKQGRPSLLSLAMPRSETPDNSEPAFLLERPYAAAQAPTTSRPSRKSPVSIFSSARLAVRARRERGKEPALSEHDPFCFSSAEEREPLAKRLKKAKGKKPNGRNKVKGKHTEQSCGGIGGRRKRTCVEVKASESSSSREMEVVDKLAVDAFPLRRDGEGRPGPSNINLVEADGEGPGQSVRIHQITRTRTIRTVTVTVQRVVTVKTVNKATGEVMNEVSYQENEDPTVESQEHETEQEAEILQSVERESQQRSRLKLLSPKKGVTGRGKSPRSLHRSGDGSSGAGQGTSRRLSSTTPETEPVSESSDSPLEQGTRVFARWLDSHYYPGCVIGGPTKSGLYHIAFDDGDRRRIPPSKLIVKDLLPVNQEILVQSRDASFQAGRIIKHCRLRGEPGYVIERTDGTVEKSPVSRVILTASQAAVVRSSSSSATTSSPGSGARLRRSTGRRSAGEDASSPLLFSPGTASGRETGASSERAAAAAGEKESSPELRTAEKSKALDGSETPKSSLKRKFRSRGARGKRRAETSSETTSSDDNRKRTRRGLSLGAGPLPTSDAGPTLRRSPRKRVSDRATEGETGREGEMLRNCPMPRDGRLFAGLAFLISSVRRSKDPDESDSESERVAFNRKNLSCQIEAGGGKVLTGFPESMIATNGAEGLFLISDTFQRTQKYFLALATGVPCVSHAWIHDSCITNTRRDYRTYLLPSGMSLETGEVAEYRLKRHILKGMTVFLQGSADFRKTWSPVLSAAGCSLVPKLPTRAEEPDFECDVVICGNASLSTRIKHAVDTLGIPVVSIEWLLQCLINGTVVRFNGHPKYDCKYVNPDQPS